jgi:hypothetical protein
MKEKRIQFQTSELAKAKGFNLEVNTFFNVHEVLIEHGHYGNVSFKDWNNYNEPIGKKGKCYNSAPTQSLLQAWLRDIHNIVVLADFDKNKDGKGIMYTTNWQPMEELHKGGYSDEQYNTYEEALEVGLIEGLKLIP